MLFGIKLVIFDMDGVLIDSKEAIVETFNKVLAELNEPPQPSIIIEGMIGETLYDMFKKILPNDKHNKIQWCFDRFPQIYVNIASKKTKLLPGVIEILDHFKTHKLKLSIATTKRSYVAKELLSNLGILNYFDLILGINDVSSPKPSPEIIQKTLSRFGIESNEAVFLEDTTIGLEAGKKAGVYVIGLTTGTHSREKMSDLKPYMIIDKITELKEIISL
ncbi:HAD family hydrolase [Candidatus Bathyarchaeota archaeon]|nr:HAD family hydrolase [Candidatus Bathyarchaeota archaeon]